MLRQLGLVSILVALAAAGVLVAYAFATANGSVVTVIRAEPTPEIVALRAEADSLFDRGRYAESIERYSATIVTGMTDVTPLGRLALAQAILERPEAAATARRALALNARDPSANGAVCLRAILDGGETEALPNCELAADQTSPLLLAIVAQNYLGARQPSAAQATLRAAIALNPNLWAVHWTQGAIHEANGDYPRAIESYRSSIGVQPDIPLVHRSLGTVLRSHGVWGLAVQEFEAAIRLKADDARAYYGLAVCYYSQRDYASSVQYLQRSTAIDAGFPPAWRILGWSEYFRQNHEAALNAFSRATALDKADPDSWVGLGWSRYALYHNAESRQAFETALRLSPNSAAAREGLAALQRRGG